MTFDKMMGHLAEWMPQLMVAAGQTAKMAALSYVLALILGFGLALSGMSRRRWLSQPTRIYLEIVRGTPTLVQLFLVYFGLASLGVVIPGFTAAVLTLSLHYAAYMSEVYRSGIEAVPRGQSEAARAIGMTWGEVMRFIIFPQSVRIVLPPLVNNAISLLKDTSVASLIAAPELMMRANDLTAESYMPMQLYLIAGVMYFVMAYPLSLGVRWLEHSSRRGQQR